MTEELVRQYTQQGICYVPSDLYHSVKMKLDDIGADYHQTWDNSFQRYIFTEKRGQLI